MAVSPYAALVCLQTIRRWQAATQLNVDEQRRLDFSDTGYAIDGRLMTHQQVIAYHHLDKFTDMVLDPEADQQELMDLLRNVVSDIDRASWAQNQIYAAVENVGY